MKILMVNKFLYPKGGAEVYMLKLGEYLQSVGEEIQYFGMAADKNIVGNSFGGYTEYFDYHQAGILQKARHSLDSIYSWNARKAIKGVLEQFRPNIVHLNNINFQITPAILYEIKKHQIPTVQTVHDVQIACPNHRFYIEKSGALCQKCLSGHYINCLKYRCLNDSVPASALAALEAYYYHKRDTYNLVDKYICPSRFIARQLIRSGIHKDKLEVLANFSDYRRGKSHGDARTPYAFYFGRLSQEKGIKTLLDVCKQMPQIHFIIAGKGPLEKEVKNIQNIEFVGFQSGEQLQELIEGARFSVYPSEWYENCPLSIIESLSLGTPVIASDLGGAKELIVPGKNGLLFKAGDAKALAQALLRLWNDREGLLYMRQECLKNSDYSREVYAEKIMKIYQKEIERTIRHD